MGVERTAIVTGGARGLGEAICLSLLDSGARVVVTDVGADELEAFAQRHRDRAEDFVTVVADVAEEAHWDRVLDTAQERFGAPNVLVNNAGISPKRDGRKVLTAQLDLDEWRRVLDVNLTGAFLGTRAVLPHMQAARWGRIVNVASQAARTGARVAGVHYGATKAALLGLTRTVAHEYGADGITVNAVAPGRFITPMATVVSEDVNAAMLSTIPVGRFGELPELGAVVAFLCGEQAGFVTGATIDVNGGSFMG